MSVCFRRAYSAVQGVNAYCTREVIKESADVPLCDMIVNRMRIISVAED